MKIDLLPQGGIYYKAGMHTHTQVSDGKFTPEETKRAYMDKGYSIVAFTDHEVFVPHNELTDERFVALNAVEVSIGESHNGPSSTRKCYHLNLYAKDPSKTACAVLSPRYVKLERMQAYLTDEAKQYDYVRHYSVKKVNEMIEKANGDGFLVCYNHPVWSVQDYEDYVGLEGLWGLEVYNYSCVVYGFYETEQPYVDLLRKNKTVFPVAADDTHSEVDYAGGWLMVHAEHLDYTSVTDALARGEFYASAGPEIREFSIDGNTVHVSCSEAVNVIVATERRTVFHKYSEDAPLTDVTLDLTKYFEETKNASYLPWRPFLRLVVVDRSGRAAYTRPYYLDELPNA